MTSHLYLVREEFPEVTSWRPAPAWEVVAWRGFGEARQRFKCSVPTIADGRRRAGDLVAAGWESAEVREKPDAPRRVRASGPAKKPPRTRRRRGARRRKLGAEGALALDLAPLDTATEK